MNEWSTKKIANFFTLISIAAITILLLVIKSTGHDIVSNGHALSWTIHKTGGLYVVLLFAAIGLETAIIYGLFEDSFFIETALWVWLVLIGLWVAVFFLFAFHRYQAGHDINESKFYIDFATQKGWPINPPQTN